MSKPSKPITIPPQRNNQSEEEQAKSVPIDIPSPPLARSPMSLENFVGSYKGYLKLEEQQRIMKIPPRQEEEALSSEELPIAKISTFKGQEEDEYDGIFFLGDVDSDSEEF